MDSGQSRLMGDFRNDKLLIPSQIFSVVSLNSVVKNIAFLVILAFPKIQGFNNAPLRFGLEMADLRPSALKLLSYLWDRDRFTWVTVRDDKLSWIPGHRYALPGMTAHVNFLRGLFKSGSFGCDMSSK